MKEAMESFGKLLDAIPRNKKMAVFDDAQTVEVFIRKQALLLVQLRGYFLETTGEASPFVKRIDELIPRPAVKEETKDTKGAK